jgi:hypothetical protein
MWIAPTYSPPIFMRHNHAMKTIIHKAQNPDEELEALLPKVRERILQSLADGETEHARRQLAILEKITKISPLISEIQTPNDHKSGQKQRDDLMKKWEERFERLSGNS